MVTGIEEALLFKNLSRQEQQKLRAISRRKNYHRDQLIFRKGDPPGPLYAVCGGQVRVSIETDAGEETIAVLEEGHHLGEMSFIEKSPRSANGIANTEPTVLVAVDDRKLEKLMAENVMIRYRILRVFADTLLSRLESTHRQFASTLVMALAETRMKGPNEVMSETTFQYPEDAASILARGGDLRDAAMVDKALAGEILRVILPELSRRLREIDRRLRIAKEL